MRSLATLAALTLSAGLLTGCGGNSADAYCSELEKDKTYFDSLGSGDIEKFDQARAHMTPQSPDYMRASMGRFRALARLDSSKSGTSTRGEFLTFQKEHKELVQDVEIPKANPPRPNKDRDDGDDLEFGGWHFLGFGVRTRMLDERSSLFLSSWWCYGPRRPTAPCHRRRR